MFSIVYFFFKNTATTDIYTLSLHDALPISSTTSRPVSNKAGMTVAPRSSVKSWPNRVWFVPIGFDTRNRSEEHTSELQSRRDLVCRLLLEKKKTEKDYLWLLAMLQNLQ